MIIKNVSRSVLSGFVGDKKYVLEPGETAQIPEVMAGIWIGRNEAAPAFSEGSKPDAIPDTVTYKNNNPDDLPLGGNYSGKGDNKEGKKK